MELAVGVFNLPNVTAIVPTVTAIANALTADPDLNTMAVAGSYITNAPDTEGVKTMKIYPVPHSLVGL